MALFEKISNETQADESIFAGVTGGIITTLLCIPAVWSAASKYLTASNHYEREPDLFLYPHLPEIILCIVLIGVTLLFSQKKKVWIGILLLLLAISRLIILHGLQSKPYGMGLFFSFAAIVLLIEGIRGAKSAQHFAANPSIEDDQDQEKFSYDEFEASEKIKLGSYGGYTISTFIFFSIFLLIFSDARTQMIANAGLAPYLGTLAILTLFMLVFVVLSWRMKVRKDTKSAIALLFLFSIYMAFAIFAIVANTDTASDHTVSLIIPAIILVLLVLGVIATIKYNRKYGTKNKV